MNILITYKSIISRRKKLTLKVIQVPTHLLLQQFFPLLSSPSIIPDLSVFLEGLILFLISQPLHLLLQNLLLHLESSIRRFNHRLQFYLLQLPGKLTKQFELIQLFLLKSKQHLLFTNQIVHHRFLKLIILSNINHLLLL